MSGNTTAIHCNNEMGTSHSMECHHQVLKIWEWTVIQKNYLSLAHISKKLNTVAEKESRSNHVNTEWMLQSKFLNLESNQEAVYIEAFSTDWSNLTLYAFLPILVIPRAFSKVKLDSEDGIMVVPFRLTEVWYPAMLKMLVLTPILINSRKSPLVLPHTTNQVHAIWKKISMLGVHFLGSLQKSNHCQEMLLESYQLHGEWEQGKGSVLVSKGVSS